MDKALEMAREDLLKSMEVLDLKYTDRALLLAHLEAFIEEVVRAASTAARDR